MTAYVQGLLPVRCAKGDGPHVKIQSVDPFVLVGPGGGADCWCTERTRAVRGHAVTLELAPGIEGVDAYQLLTGVVERGIERGDDEGVIRRAVHDAAIKQMTWTARGGGRRDLERLHASTCVDGCCPARAPKYSATMSIYGEKPDLGRRDT